MINRSTGQIRVGGKVADEAEAIRLAAGLLIKQGTIEPGLAGSMLTREKVARCQVVLRHRCSTRTRSS